MAANSASDETESHGSPLEEALARPRVVRFALWQALLAILICILSTILFATAATLGAKGKLGALGQAAKTVADAPVIARRVIIDYVKHRNVRLARLQRFDGASGLFLSAGGAPKGAALLVSRYDGDLKRGVVELVDLDSGETTHVWRADIDQIHRRSKLPKKIVNLPRDFNAHRYVYTHPYALADGSLIFQGMGSPLVRIDVCSKVQWVADGAFHHAIERAPDGSFWTAQRLIPTALSFVDETFNDDAIVNLSPDGDILFRKSVAEMLIEAGLSRIVYSHNYYDPDPIHLNDVQPAPADGPFWKKGDVFLSLRTPSMLVQYRPSTNEVLWWKQGPWLMQHDVDIISDHEIGVFSNNAVASPNGPKTLRPNDVVVFDFADGRTRTLNRRGFERFNVKTETSGLFRLFPDGTLMAEEHDYGRIIAFDAEGALRWRYVNRAPKDGRVFQLGWSRFIEAADAAALKATIAKASCDAR